MATVLDLGAVIKIGKSTSETPELVTSLLVGKVKQQYTIDAPPEVLKCPLSRGNVTDWEGTRNALNQLFPKVKGSTESPLLVSVHASTPQDTINKLAEIFLVEMKIPSVKFVPKPLLALYSAGVTCGFSVYIGDSCISWAPLYEGFTDRIWCTKIPFGGNDITDYLGTTLYQANPFLKAKRNRVELEKIKKDFCFVSRNFEAEMQIPNPKYRIQHKAKEGTVNLENERFWAPELLFKPDLMDLSIQGLHYFVADTILNCPLDMRQDISKSIILGGSTSRLPGLKERMLDELQDIHPQVFNKAIVKAGGSKPYDAWTGGSILASILTPKDYLNLSKYNEGGRPDILF